MPTPIEWCDETFNPWWGCERVSPACAHCYADTFARRIGMPDLWSEKDHRAEHGFRFFADPHWAEPLKWARTLPDKLGRRPRVFCASMADVFEDRPEVASARFRLLSLICDTPELDWLVLTKRPEFARDWLQRAHSHASPYDTPLPLNLWLGVSIENSRFTWRADVLREIPAAVRFISAEPLLGSLFDGRPMAHVPQGRIAYGDPTQPVPVRRAALDLSGIDWVIIGGESGPKSRPFHVEHARELVSACRAYRSEWSGGGHFGHSRPAVFVKQLGAKPVTVGLTLVGAPDYPLKLRDRKGGDPEEWPADLWIREFPLLRDGHGADHHAAVSAHDREDVDGASAGEVVEVDVAAATENGPAVRVRAVADHGHGPKATR